MKYLLISFLVAQGIIAQQTDKVDLLRIEASIGIENIIDAKIGGRFLATFKMKKAVDSVFLDAIDMTLTEIKSTDFKVAATDKKIWFTGDFKAGKTYLADFRYEAHPRQTLYFTGDQVWTQGQGKYTSHWLPSIDDMNDKIEFDLQILAPSDRVVIANGALVSVDVSNDIKGWRFDMDHPMSSYLAAFVIGDFDKKVVFSESGIPIELYFKPEDSLKAEPTYRYTKEIFDFLEKEIGVPYPWQNYKQVPVRDFLYAGMENTTATIFSEAFVVDSTGFNDRNFVNVNAHELAHHWFGNLVTESSGTHHWLQEGFATYYAHLAEKELFGEDYFYWMLYQTAEQLQTLSDKGQGESLLNPKASSLTFYEKGAWALHILRELVGDTAFKTGVKNYLELYQFGNVSTEDFVSEIKKASSVDISKWEKDWLHQSAFKGEDAYNSLKRSKFMVELFMLKAAEIIPLTEKTDLLKKAINSGNEFLGQEAIYQLVGAPMEQALPLYKAGFDTGDLMIRQAIAYSLFEVPDGLLSHYESLLNDDSYITKEIALTVLWNRASTNHRTYLDQLKGVAGFQDKNVRQLWLVLAYLTEDYNPSAKPIYLKELKGYTSKLYSFEIRKKAFEYIQRFSWFDHAVLDNLVDATVHHNWRFRSYARNLLQGVIETRNFRDVLSSMIDRFSEREQNYLRTILDTQ